MTVDVAIAGRAHTGGLPLPLKLLGDERLARLVGEANGHAFAVLYERHHQPLYRYCRSLLRNDADAQDALQSTMAGAFAALTRGQRDAPLRPWMYRIAHNEAVSLLRRRRPEAEVTEAAELAGASVEERVDERARVSQLLADMRELPERQRGALVMRELGGLSHQEIAIALATSVGGAKQTIFEARRSLLEFEEGRAMECEAVRRTISDGDRRALRGRRIRAHLRYCRACTGFAASISERTAQLRALAPPLPALVASGLLARVLGGGSGHGGGGTGALLAGAAGKTASVTMVVKSIAAVAVVVSATAGATVALRHSTTSLSPASRHTQSTPAGGTISTINGAGAAAISHRSGAALAGAGLGDKHGPSGRVRGAGETVSNGPPRGVATAAVHSVVAAVGLAGGSGAANTGSLLRGSSSPGGHSRSTRGGGSGSSSAGSRSAGRTHTGRPGTAGGGNPHGAGGDKPPAAGGGSPHPAGGGNLHTTGGNSGRGPSVNSSTAGK